MSKIIEKYLEATTLNDPTTLTAGQTQTPITNYEYVGVFVPSTGYGILRGLVNNIPFSPQGIGQAQVTPNGPNLFIANQTTANLVVTLGNVIFTAGTSASTMWLGVGPYGTCTVPKEWWTPTSTITIGQTSTPSTGPASNPLATPYNTVTTVDILFWS